MDKKILVLGYFGYNNNQLDGQTVKTRDVYRLLAESYPNCEVVYFDTQDLKYNKLSVIKMFRRACRCNDLVYLPAHNNLKYIFPFLFFLSKIFRFKIHYFVVGGWLSNYIKQLPLHRNLLKRIKGVHVETKRLKSELETIHGFKNVDIFPNFRFFDFEPETHQSEKFKIVFMARVNRQKGLDWIFELAEHIAGNNLSAEISITFFGPVNEDDKDYFFNKVANYDFMEYKGELQPDEIYRTLCHYDLMLLPTHYYTEGLPGSIVDAYISGIPVIATEWLNAREFIEDGKTGFVIPFENGQKNLIERVIYLRDNPEVLTAMKQQALIKRLEFTPPSNIHLII